MCVCVRFWCSCTCVGVPQPRIEWFKDAVPLSKLANPRYKVTAATGLTVRRVQPGDGGIFQCLARNAAGETQAHTQLLVSSEFVWHTHDKTHTCDYTSTTLFPLTFFLMCLRSTPTSSASYFCVTFLAPICCNCFEGCNWRSLSYFFSWGSGFFFFFF